MEGLLSTLTLIAIPSLQFLVDFTLAWWWLFLPFILFERFKFHWLWWRTDKYLSKSAWTVLEVKIPQEINNPFRRMEAVLAGMWQVKIGSNKREKWLEGKVQLGVSLDIVSLEGRTHFYVRSENGDIELVKTSIYSQFPEAEITPVEDYAKQVPSDIPNKEWDMWSTIYKFTKPSPYPIKVYKKFFEEDPTVSEDEPIRVDPLGQLLEGMSKLGPGEQMWLQIAISPREPKQLKSFLDESEKIVNTIVRRPEKEKPATAVSDAKSVASILLTGNAPAKEEKKEEILPPEMRITPGEKEIVTALEEKDSKTMFECMIRSLYLAKRDVFFGGHKAVPMSYFNQFSSLNLNSLVVDGDTWTKVHTVSTWFLDKRRLYLRKRKHFRLYRDRLPQHFPGPGGTFYLNTEEVATIYHFPGKLTAPGAGVPRVEAKKGEAPAGLPME
ncbi:MAG: hypothetical protein HYT50_01935 [Candidatus Wildermuthbacteria bacterium]|nr:hypothetical protein [Candidatus Wildermuthbacteria bacterium]